MFVYEKQGSEQPFYYQFSYLVWIGPLWLCSIYLDIKFGTLGRKYTTFLQGENCEKKFQHKTTKMIQRWFVGILCVLLGIFTGISSGVIDKFLTSKQKIIILPKTLLAISNLTNYFLVKTWCELFKSCREITYVISI